MNRSGFFLLVVFLIGVLGCAPDGAIIGEISDVDPNEKVEGVVEQQSPPEGGGIGGEGGEEGLGSGGEDDHGGTKGEDEETGEGEVGGGEDEETSPFKGVTWKIVIKDLSLVPRELTISKGDKVIWENQDERSGKGLDHFLVSHQDLFRSERFSKDESFSYVFNSSGTFTYFDVLYKKKTSMKGTIVVK
tara:strand:+ start:279 stop:845 length:567 start_codon:yes stop_codon:yes gene_type:complete